MLGIIFGILLCGLPILLIVLAVLVIIQEGGFPLTIFETLGALIGAIVSMKIGLWLIKESTKEYRSKKAKQKYHRNNGFLRFLFLLLGVGSIVLGIYIADSDNFGVFLMFFGILFIALGIWWNTIIRPILELRASGKVASFVSFDYNSEILTVSKRDPEIAKSIKIVNDKDVTIDYEPEKLHIGAVTVGGVTTGGTYTTGGYHYISSIKDNGKCSLEYCDNLIKKIQLSKDLYEQAKTSDIAEYLDKETLQMQARWVSLEQCIKIMDWLTTIE